MRLKTKNKIPSITNVATTSGLKAKVNEMKNKIPNHTNLSATTDLLLLKIIFLKLVM